VIGAAPELGAACGLDLDLALRSIGRFLTAAPL
jgi:hypothetical protein